MTLLTLLKPRARPVIDPAIARRLGWGPKAPHFVQEVWEYPPTTPDGSWLVQRLNPDTGPVDLAIHADRAEAWLLLAERLDDDL